MDEGDWIAVIALVILGVFLSIGALVAASKKPEFAGHPKGLLHAVLCRDVGTLLLLRHARAADLLPDAALAVFGRQIEPDLRRLYRARSTSPPCSADISPTAIWGSARRAVRRCAPRVRPFVHGLRGRSRHHRCRDEAGRSRDQHLLARARAHHRRLGLPQGQYLGDGRPALSPDRHAPRCGLHHLLHGH